MLLKLISIPALLFALFLTALLPGPSFCRRSTDQPIATTVAQVTRYVQMTAKLASEVTESLIELQNPWNPTLYHTDILQRPFFAVQYSTDSDNREVLAEQLMELSGLTKDVKEHVIGLNSEGISVSNFVAYKFSKFHHLVELIQSGNSIYTTQSVCQELEALLSQLSRDLLKPLLRIKRTIPIVSRAASLGTRTTRQLSEEQRKLIKTKESAPLWRKLLENDSLGETLLKDCLDRTSETVENLVLTWQRLEALQTMMIDFRTELTGAKTSMVVWHDANDQLSEEDEVDAMKDAIDDFKDAAKASEAKQWNA